MFKRLNRLFAINKTLSNIETLYKEELTEEDVNNISTLFVDSRYKSIEKLYNNIIIDLQNRTFARAEKLEEFMGVKWTIQVLKLLQQEIKNKYFNSIKKQYGKNTPSPEDLEQFPDGIPIQGHSN